MARWRLAECHAGGGGVKRLDFRRRGLVAIANAHVRGDGRWRALERDPIHVAHDAGAAAQLGIFSDDEAIRRNVDGDNDMGRPVARPSPRRCPTV